MEEIAVKLDVSADAQQNGVMAATHAEEELAYLHGHDVSAAIVDILDQGKGQCEHDFKIATWDTTRFGNQKVIVDSLGRKINQIYVLVRCKRCKKESMFLSISK